MDQGDPSPAPRKVKFSPKAPPRRKAKRTESKTEGADDGETAEADYLLRRVYENTRRQGPKFEKISTVQAGIGFGTTPSASIRSYGIPKDGASNSGSKNTSSKMKVPSSSTEQPFPLPLTTQIKEIDERSDDAATTDAFTTDDVNAPIQIIKKEEYREVWDYHHSNYPISLPWRRPYSGNPELLDEAEFGETSTKSEYDENAINPALELGFLEENEKAQMLFVQLPANLPLTKRSASAKGKDGLSGRGFSEKGCSLEELSGGGFMGKMLVYKSGAIKLKLGDTLYDVSPGSDCIFAQDVVAINTVEKHCCSLGEVEKRIVLTPDVESILNSVINLD